MFTSKTTLIVPTKNRSLKLIKLLNSILKYKIKFNEIIVIDSSNPKHKKKILKYIKKRKIRFLILNLLQLFKETLD